MLNLIVIIFFPLAAFLGLFWYFKKMQARGFAVKDELEQKYGDDLKMISGCVLLKPASRRPAILARLPDRFLFISLSKSGKPTAEIAVDDVENVQWLPAAAFKERKIKRYRGSMVLNLLDNTGQNFIFVVAQGLAEHWAKQLLDLPGFAKEEDDTGDPEQQA